MPSTFLPQGLCISYSLCLDGSNLGYLQGCLLYLLGEAQTSYYHRGRPGHPIYNVTSLSTPLPCIFYSIALTPSDIFLKVNLLAFAPLGNLTSMWFCAYFFVHFVHCCVPSV